MAFGRRKDQIAAPVEQDEEFVDDLSSEERAAEDAELLLLIEREQRVTPLRPQGPWDTADAPPRDGEQMRIDLGGLQVPVPAGAEVRVDVSPEGEVVAATLVRGDSALQLNAFAAPRSEGIWDEIRAEIAEAISAGGGSAQDADGPFGTELRATVPTEVPEQGVVMAPARFLGVDGPRWFLRGLITGLAATDVSEGTELENALRDVVVVRGNEPMAVRDALPLVLPAEVVAGDTGQADEPAADGDPLRLPERGPEITETY